MNYKRKNSFKLNEIGLNYQKKIIKENIIALAFVFFSVLCISFYSFFRAKIFIDKGADFPTLPILFVLIISIFLLARVSLSFAKDLSKLRCLVINVEINGSSFNFYTNELSIFKNGLFRLETKSNSNIGKYLSFTEKYDKSFGNVCEIMENDTFSFLIVYKFMKNPEDLSEILSQYLIQGNKK